VRKAVTVKCQRCSRVCLAEVSQIQNARPFRNGLHGLCTNCAVTSFFKDPDVEQGVGFALPPDFDPQGLLLPHIQVQFQKILNVGQSELRYEQIEWGIVLSNWDLPIGRKAVAS